MLLNLWQANSYNPEISPTIMNEAEGVLKGHGLVDESKMSSSGVQLSLVADASATLPSKRKPEQDDHVNQGQATKHQEGWPA